LRESQHPFTFIVERGLEHLIDAVGAAEKISQIMPAVVGPLRSALAVKEKVRSCLVTIDALSQSFKDIRQNCCAIRSISG
jgi:Parkin co-regulated protein